MRKCLEIEAEEDREKTKLLTQIEDNNGSDMTDLALLTQKYANKKRQIQSSDLIYADPSLKIEPAQSTIWPHSSVTCKVVFCPSTAKTYSKVAYCEIEGREMRLPLQLKGQGIGPRARFSFDVLDIEKVFINSAHKYEFTFENRGDIPVKFSLQQNDSKWFDKIQFEPSHGVVEVGDEMTMRIAFTPDILGEFNETFKFSLEGSSEPLKMTCRGTVVGPTFEFDYKTVDYGKISYGFPVTKELKLRNTCAIPMTYRLRMEDKNGSHAELAKEFKFSPRTGTLTPGGLVDINVEFLPSRVKIYDVVACVDIDGVGESVYKLPITGESVVPDISLKRPIMDLEECFLEHTYCKQIELVNTSAFAARYSIHPQDEVSIPVYTYSPRSPSGVIQPNSIEVIDIDVQIKRLGQLNFPIAVHIAGSDEGPLSAEFSANGIGPYVTCSTLNLNFGNIPVLKKAASKLTLHNNSPIPAFFTCGTVNDASVFKVSPTEGMILPNNKVELSMSAFLDDNVKFTDILKVGIKSSATHEVQLVARGQGTTIVFDEGLAQIDFGDVFSNRECAKEFVMVNKGRRTQTLVWGINDKKVASAPKDSIASLSMFEVYPPRFTLKPEQQQTIIVKGRSNKAFVCKETLICHGSYEKDPNRRTVTESVVTANFMNPLVEANPPLLKFICAHDEDSPIPVISQPLVLKNSSPLPLHLTLKCPSPYSVYPNQPKYLVKPGDSYSVQINYDPSSHNFDRTSMKESAKLSIVYTEHPQKDIVELYSELSFPNLAFDTTKIDFGCIPNETELVKRFKITNTSKLPVNFSWTFLEDEMATSPVALSQIFDVLPLRGMLMPGDSEMMDVYFYGPADSKYDVTAVCNVIGGPKYQVQLHGEASSISYAFDTQKLDFGSVAYQEISEKEIVLTNTGRVPFEYSCMFNNNSTLFDKVIVYPSSGLIPALGKQKITVRFSPTIPDTIDDVIFVQVSHFEPSAIQITGSGYSPRMLLSLPRASDSEFATYLNKAKGNNASVTTSRMTLSSQEQDQYEKIAERQYLRAVTGRHLKNLSDSLIAKISNQVKVKVIGSVVLMDKFLPQLGGTAKEAGVRKDRKQMSECSNVVLGSYMCDFGNVIRNTSRKRVVKIFNKGTVPLNFVFDDTVLENGPFSVDIDKSKCQLQPFENVEVDITFKSTNSHFSEGNFEATLPVRVNGGPSAIIALRARVTMPELLVTPSTADFGEVLVGTRKTVYIQLHNSHTVPCEWSAALNSAFEASSKDKKGRRGGQSFKEFSFSPANGTLSPHEKVLISARFTPLEERAFEFIVPIKIGTSSKSLNVKISAHSVMPRISFSPEALFMGPVLPYLDISETKVTVSNPTNYPIEVYSVDFDSQYLEDEEMLRKFGKFENGQFFGGIRSPGQSLTETLPDLCKGLLSEKFSDNDAKASEHGLNIDSANATSRLSRIDHASDPPCHIILHGAPFSGRTAIAKKISGEYGHLLINADEIIEAHPNFEAQKTAAMSSFKSTKEVKESLAEGLEPAKSMMDLAPATFFDQSIILSDEFIVEALRSKLVREEHSRPIVVDGIESKYTNNPITIVRGVVRGISDKRKIVFVNLAVDIANLSKRESVALKIGSPEDPELAQYKTFSEEEIDAMSPAEREKYQESFFRYKKRLKEIADRKQKEKARYEMESLKAGQVAAEQTKPRKGDKEKTQTSATAVVNKDGKEKPTEKADKPEKQEKDKLLSVKVHSSKVDADDGAGSVKGDFDIPAVFVDRSTYRRYELYCSTLDAIQAFLKEGDKMSLNIAGTEKKGGRTKGNLDVNNAGTDVSDDSSIASFENVDANASVVNVFSKLSEMLPKRRAEIDASIDNTKNAIPAPIVEQVYIQPKQRDGSQQARRFTIITNPLLSLEENTDENSESPQPALSSSQVLKPESSSKKTRSKTPQIQAEEIKVPDIEEELDNKEGKYRFVIPANGKKEILVRFANSEIGKIEHALGFEIVGCQAKYTLPCVGTSQYAQIINDPRKVFAKWRKVKEDPNASTPGEFIMNTGTFEFGPILCNKPRNANSEKLGGDSKTVLSFTNTSISEVKVNFGFKNDSKGDIFLVEPASLDIAPGATQNISVWAYPKAVGSVDDVLVCCVKDNPEPYCYKMSAIGVKPEIELDKKTFAFEKQMLLKSDKREIKLKNNTLLAVGWKLSGFETLNDEFVFSATEGIVQPLQEYALVAEFKATKPSVMKKNLKLDIFDADKLMNVAQSENINISGEAYDVSIDLHFPNRSVDGLDFGTIKVFDESKLSFTLKNKGRYEVGYKFVMDSKDFNDVFIITPSHGVAGPGDKPISISIAFKSDREVNFKESVSLKCHVLEPTSNELLCAIPVKVSARSVFSKYTILPVRDLNFGALIHGTKGTRVFTIENNGEFDFKYIVTKAASHNLALKDNKNDHKGHQRKGRHSVQAASLVPSAAAKVVQRREITTKVDQTNFGPFVISPITGVISAGTKQQVTVEFSPEYPGSYEENIAVDISDRAPSDGDAAEYHLVGESCIPGINTTEFSSIFEEHTVCKRVDSNMLPSSVYAEDERVFYFGAFLAGQQAQARFRISNPYKVPCEVAISTKPRNRAATKTDVSDYAFDVEPKHLSIPSHEHRYVVVTFNPTSIQSYAGVFEAIVENVVEFKSRILSFDLRAEGTLPRVIVEKPNSKTKQGLPLLRFKKLLVGQFQTLPVVLKNDGIMPAKFKLDWAFKDSDDFDCRAINTIFALKPQERQTVNVMFSPSSVHKAEAELRLKVIDNNFEDASVQLSGEGFLDDLTFEDLGGENGNELVFSDCFIGEQKTMVFTATNHSADVLRLAFSEHPEFVFSPHIVHIRSKASKEITVSLVPKQPVDYKQLPIQYKVSKIQYTGSFTSNDFEWDDELGSRGEHALALKKPSDGNAIIEPSFDVKGTPTEQSILVSAFAEYSTYECDVKPIQFKSTLMYQSRVYRFTIRNTGKVALKYRFVFADEEGQEVEDEPNFPFAIEPQFGSIETGSSTLFTLRFAPTDVDNYSYNLHGLMANLSKELKNLVIKVGGSSQRPFCHFELEESDYLSSERRNSEISAANGVPASLEPSTRVIEFKSCGVKVKSTKRFYIVNPTNLSYEFEWVCEAGDLGNRFFKCNTPRGLVLSGKKFEMTFEFVADTVEVKESLWRFNIIGHNVSVPFLLAGEALEPNVFVDHPSINFKSLLVGRQGKEIVNLINNEDIPFAFSFTESTFDVGQDGSPVLKFSPISGTVPARSELPIEVVFSPCAEKHFNYNLVCNVRKKPTPVTINVKGEGYDVHDSVQTELSDGTVCEFAAGPNVQNVVDLGQSQINEKRVKRVTIVNSGRFNFDFAWNVKTKTPGMFTITPEIGTVPKGERVVCELSFLPTREINFKADAICEVLNGRSYPISISGLGAKPLLKFSSTNVDFGPHFLFKPNMPKNCTPSVQVIKLTNYDVKEISYDLLYKESNIFDIQRGPSVLAPGESADITVTFYPREAQKYHETLEFEINGLSTVHVDVAGEGVEFKVEHLNPDIRTVSFGAIRIGSTIQKQVKLVNKSIIPATFTLGPASILEVLQAHCASISSFGTLTLKPKGVLTLDLKFAPNRRIPFFSEDIMLEGPGVEKTLFSVTGACQGVDVKLENDLLAFGPVCHRSSTVRKMHLQNVGDIGVKFQWDTSKFSPDFSITPPEGYLSPGMDLPLDITFHPSKPDPDIRYENLVCSIDGAPALNLTLSGSCISQPVAKETVSFQAAARQSESKGVTLVNKTNSVWHIRPIFDNDNWSGSEQIDIEAGQTKQYDIVFTPSTMAGEGENGKHEGTLFFPLPDGTGILYKLVGNVEKPLASGTVSRELTAKTTHTEIVKVQNWLKKQQRFKVIFELAKPDPAVSFKGHEFLDVPPLSSREYKFSFYSYKEGLTNAKIIFKNEASQEFLYYNLAIKSLPPGSVSSMEITTTVRQPFVKELSIANPLPTPVTFTATCQHADISVPHSFVVPPK